MNILNENAKHTKHEDELVNDAKLEKIYKCLCNKRKLVQPNSVEHNDISVLKPEKSNEKIVSNGSSSFLTITVSKTMKI